MLEQLLSLLQGHRKMLFAFYVSAGATALLVAHFIEASHWVNTHIVLIPAFLTANIMEHYVTKGKG